MVVVVLFVLVPLDIELVLVRISEISSVVVTFSVVVLSVVVVDDEADDFGEENSLITGSNQKGTCINSESDTYKKHTQLERE